MIIDSICYMSCFLTKTSIITQHRPWIQMTAARQQSMKWLNCILYTFATSKISWHGHYQILIKTLWASLPYQVCLRFDPVVSWRLEFEKFMETSSCLFRWFSPTFYNTHFIQQWSLVTHSEIPTKCYDDNHLSLCNAFMVLGCGFPLVSSNSG